MKKRQAEEYVKKGWGHCPYCKAFEIEGGSFDFDGNQVFQEVSCLVCEKTWVDVYTLTDVREGPL